jgi:hypothetical protein
MGSSPFGYPRLDIGGVIFPNLRREVEIGAKERCAKLGDKLLDGVAFVAKTLATKISRQALTVFCPVGQLVPENGGETFRIAEGLVSKGGICT